MEIKTYEHQRHNAMMNERQGGGVIRIHALLINVRAKITIQVKILRENFNCVV